jgi:hypothetical protein
MSARHFSLLFGLYAMVLATVACTINVGGPSYPDQHIPVSTESMGEFHDMIQTALASGTVSGEATYVITEQQMTSFFAAELQAQTQPLFTDPQVFFQQGQIQIYGTVQQGYFQATVGIVVSAGVDSQGNLSIEITSADFGPLHLPAGLKEAITAAIQETYTGSIGPAAVGFRLESITITNGTMVLVGRTK